MGTSVKGCAFVKMELHVILLLALVTALQGGRESFVSRVGILFV